jgi:shikimate kinase
VGPAGVGKTTVGKKLANNLGLPLFIESSFSTLKSLFFNISKASFVNPVTSKKSISVPFV